MCNKYNSCLWNQLTKDLTEHFLQRDIGTHKALVKNTKALTEHFLQGGTPLRHLLKMHNLSVDVLTEICLKWSINDYAHMFLKIFMW